MMQNLAESFLLWRKHCQHRIQPIGITLKQAFVLRMVSETELNPSKIAELLFTDRATTSVMLQNMARRGWIQKRRDNHYLDCELMIDVGAVISGHLRSSAGSTAE